MAFTDNVCAIWYIYIDGSHCQPTQFGVTLALLDDPAAVTNETRTVEAEGYCEGIAAGVREISLYVDQCPSYYNDGPTNVKTGGFNTVQRMIVEEFRLQSNINAVLSTADRILYRVPQMNIVTHSSSSLPGADENNGAVWVLDDYHKLYHGSGLRLSLSGTGRTQKLGDSNCCRHYFMINDAECSNPGSIEGVHFLNVDTINYHSPIIIEGICDGIPAGTVQVAIYAGYCNGNSAGGSCHLGWSGYTHVMISESYVKREMIP